ncbi:MAG TPA: hypothetical protein VEP89_15285 [Draconibacterium sp.]|nr:hypothetical protein [Draconibacterium sp.]
MRTLKFYKTVFLIAAAYDLILGVSFFVLYQNVYTMFNIPLPETEAYLQLNAAFVFAQGILYWFVYRNIKRNVDIVKVAIVYKLAYAWVALYNWGIGELPHAVFAVFGLIDVAFIALFLLFLTDYRKVTE